MLPSKFIFKIVFAKSSQEKFYTKKLKQCDLLQAVSNEALKLFLVQTLRLFLGNENF